MNILCIGDSLTYCMGVSRMKAWTSLAAKATGHTVFNHGICGDTTGGMLARLQPALTETQVKTVMIMGGTNDLICGGTPSGAAANCMAMAAQVVHAGGTPILCVPPATDPDSVTPNWGTPAEFRAVNGALAQYREKLMQTAKLFQTPCIDFFNLMMAQASGQLSQMYLDGLHLSAAGNSMMAELVINQWRKL